MKIHRRKVEIETRDGRKLAGILLEPQEPRLCVLISPGVAIPKEHYLLFARAGASRGATVLIFDYRAQGGSILGHPRDELADFDDWGRLDLVAATDYLDRLHPDLDMVNVGHSAGGWIAGLAPNHHRISRYCFICSGWAYWRLKPLWLMPVELFFWHVYGPLSLGLFGHIPSGGLWQGEPLNPKLFKRWKAWCNTPRCDASVLAGGHEHFFDQITVPIHSFAYRDDPIVNERTLPLLLEAYCNAKHTVTWAEPAQFGVPNIGHEGLFDRRAAKAWVPIWDWIVPVQPADPQQPA